MANESKTTDKPTPIERTEENIARITQQLIEEGFKRATPEQRAVFEQIKEGRLEGYTPENCPHPQDAYVPDGHYLLCTQCGHGKLT